MDAADAGDVAQLRATWQDRDARAGTPPRRASGGTTPPRTRTPAQVERATKLQAGLARAEASLPAAPRTLSREPPPLPAIAGLSGSLSAARSAARSLRATMQQPPRRETIHVDDDPARRRSRAATIQVDADVSGARHKEPTPDLMSGLSDIKHAVEQEFDGLLSLDDPAVVPRRSRAQQVAAVLSLLALLALLAAIVLSVAWGSVSTIECAGRDCSGCAADEACTWCPGPDPSMPGYCELSTLNSDSTCGQPDEARCEREDSEEKRWEICRGQTESLGCELTQSAGGEPSCQWCNNSVSSQVCVPLGGGSGSGNESFCDPDDLIFGALRPFALSKQTPACVKNRPTHVDRSSDLLR